MGRHGRFPSCTLFDGGNQSMQRPLPYKEGHSPSMKFVSLFCSTFVLFFLGCASILNTTPGGNPTARPAQGTASYRIGDTGPAGGIIFYDKGNSIGGWRFLEAAPEETEVTAPTSDAYISARTGNRKVGDGKENTEEYIKLFQQKGGGINTAPWLCNELVVNGFNDWYLPALDELLYMYNNLYMKEIGGLKTSNYWSSYCTTWFFYYLDFSDGSEQRTQSVGNRYQVRAIRRF